MKKLIRPIIIIASFFSIFSCASSILEEPTTDKKEIFEYAWKTIDERYSFFELKNIDWDAAYTRFEPGITNSMTDEQFFDSLGVMIDLLKDGHTGLTSPFNSHFYIGFFTRGPENYDHRLIVDNYYHSWGNRKGSFHHTALANNQVGYIAYSDFSNAVTDEDLNYLLEKYKDSKGIILDIRNNFGGSVDNVFQLTKRFTQEKTLLYRSRVKTGTGHNEFSEPVETWLEPADSTVVSYYGKVCVLTNRKVYSAATILTLSMRELPNVTIVGDTTGGGLGLPIGVELPNGWQVHFAGNQMLAVDGTCFELGVPPDIQVDMTKDDMDKGIDTIIETAIKTILNK
jgi:hypothetical protein